MEDSFRGLSHLGPLLKARLSVTFVNEQGLSEAGLDYGGLMKELLEEVVRVTDEKSKLTRNRPSEGKDPLTSSLNYDSLNSQVSRGFNTDFGLFSMTTSEGLVYPRPSAEKVDQGTQLLEFLGERRVLFSVCKYESIPV